MSNNAGLWQGSTTSTTTSSQFNNMVNIRRRSIQGYTLRSNEHLLYTFHFGTSQYNTLDEKAAALQNTTTYRSAPEAPELETLSPAFTGESFDVVDISGYHYGQPGYPGGDLMPLVWISDPRTDPWSTGWNQPLIYDYYASVVNSSWQYTSLRLIRGYYTWNWPGSWVWHENNTGIPPVNTVTFYPGGPAAPPLTTQETTPGPADWADFGNWDATTNSGNDAAVQLDVETALQVRADYLRMQTITSDIIAGYGSPFAVESFIAEPVRTYMRNFLNSAYWRMYTGNYQVQFHFRNPPSCPGVIYMQMPGTSAPLPGTATYYHSTGTTPYIYTGVFYYTF
jgi:hypothetical protein